MNRNEATKFWRQLRRQGFVVELTGGNHIRITHPDMRGPVFAPGSPGDVASLRNVEAKLRRKLKETLT